MKHTLLTLLALTLAATVASAAPLYQGKIIPVDVAGEDHFGSPVAISGDTLLISSPEDDDGTGNSGSAYVYVNSGGTWTEQAKLNAPAPANQRFGESLALDGDWAFVGARYHDGPSSDCGGVYVYHRTGTSWTYTQFLQSSDISSYDWFGLGVSVSGDTAVISSFGDSMGGSDSGSAYVFQQSGGAWSQVAKLSASDGGSSDWMGTSAAIDGDTIVVSAYGDDHSSLSNAGSAYVFQKPGGGWSNMTETAKLTASDAGANSYFAGMVDIDGDTIIAGARDDASGSYTGAVYVFEEPVGGWITMTETAKLTGSDSVNGDYFSTGMCIDGDRIVAAAYADDHSGLTDAGSLYLFEKPVGGWATMTETERLAAFDASGNDEFGTRMDLAGDSLFVACRYDDDGATNGGSVYEYTVPEPMTLGLLSLGGVALLRRKQD